MLHLRNCTEYYKGNGTNVGQVTRNEAGNDSTMRVKMSQKLFFKREDFVDKYDEFENLNVQADLFFIRIFHFSCVFSLNNSFLYNKKDKLNYFGIIRKMRKI